MLKTIKKLPTRTVPKRLSLINNNSFTKPTCYKKSLLAKISTSKISTPNHSQLKPTIKKNVPKEDIIKERHRNKRNKVRSIKNMYITDKVKERSHDDTLCKHVVLLRKQRPNRIIKTLRDLRDSSKVVLQYIGFYVPSNLMKETKTLNNLNRYEVLYRKSKSEEIILWNQQAFAISLMDQAIEDNDSDLSDDEMDVLSSDLIISSGNEIPETVSIGIKHLNKDNYSIADIHINDAVALIRFTQDKERKKQADIPDHLSDDECDDEMISKCCTIIDAAKKKARKRKKGKKPTKEEVAVAVDHMLLPLAKKRAQLITNNDDTTKIDSQISIIRRVLRDLKTNYTDRQIRKMKLAKKKQNTMLKHYLKKLTGGQFIRRIDLDLDEDDQYDADNGEKLRHRGRRMFHSIGTSAKGGYRKANDKKSHEFKSKMRLPNMPLELREHISERMTNTAMHQAVLLSEEGTGYHIYDPLS